MFWRKSKLDELRRVIGNLSEDVSRLKANDKATRTATKALSQKLQDDVSKLKANEKATRNATKVLSRRLNTTADLLAALYAKQWPSDRFVTAQEQAWAGVHGFRYVLAHLEENWKSTRVPFWRMLLAHAPDVASIAEFGCNIGANLKAIKSIAPSIHLAGVEINKIACDVLGLEAGIEVHNGSIIDFSFERKFDLTFSRGVLIHLNPQELTNALRNIGRHSTKYVLIYEIFSPEEHHLADYSDQVTLRRDGEGYQFWRDFPAEFERECPGWEAVASGVNLEVAKTPVHGDLYWKLFKRSSG